MTIGNTVSDFAIYSTIRIETVTYSGAKCTGTGFFYAYQDKNEPEKCIPTIVTNKHVIENANVGVLRFSVKDEHGDLLVGNRYDMTIPEKFETAWIKHPSAEIDLCILPIASIHEEALKQGRILAYSCLSKKDIPVNEELLQFPLVEDVYMVGYPDGIWDSHNNLPVVRKGITATPIQYDFMGSPKYLIDAAVFGGSSGSPVYIMNQGTYAVNNGLAFGDRLLFIGIIYAVAQHTVQGTIDFITIPTATSVPVATTQIPNNLGVVIKSSELFAFESILKVNA